MKNRILIRRYTQGLVHAVKDQAEFESLNRDLHAVLELLDSQPKLNEILQSPFLPVSKKMDVFRSVLEKVDLAPKVIRFLLLLVENGRMELFSDILTYLPIQWNEEHGIVAFEVSSVICINPAQKKLLADKLAELEKRQVSLTYKTDPSLIGGLSIRKGNIVYDISIEGSLNKLKEKIINS